MPVSASLSIASLLSRCSIVLVGILLLGGCSSGPDPDDPFYMELNGDSFTVKRKPGAAFVNRLESDWSVLYTFGVRFPTGTGMSNYLPGVEINFDPARVVEGEVIEFDEDWQNPIRLCYRPATGHRMNEAQMLVYTTERGGGGTIVFDVFDPSPNGRIAGTLIEADLIGYYDDVMDGERIEPSQPLDLVLRNFHFDCVMPDYELDEDHPVAGL